MFQVKVADLSELYNLRHVPHFSVSLMFSRNCIGPIRFKIKFTQQMLL
jgi:hypothetical protein